MDETKDFLCRIGGMWLSSHEQFHTMTSRFKFNTVGLFTHDNRSTVDFYTKTFGFADPDGNLIETGSFFKKTLDTLAR